MNILLAKFSKKIIIVIAFTIAALPTYYFYNKYQRAQQLLQNPTLAVQKESKTLVEKVGRLIELPTGEIPTIATVSDKEKLKGQLFFQRAKNGDKVLIFTQGKKAILYRPSSNKIIEVAPVNIGESQQVASPTPSAKKIKVALYNGTNVVGLTNKAESSISAKLANIEVTAKETAEKKDYPKTLVVDLSGRFENQAKELAKLLEADIASLPETEKKPKADILVIIGENYK